MTTGDANDWAVCATVSFGSGVPDGEAWGTCGRPRALAGSRGNRREDCILAGERCVHESTGSGGWAAIGNHVTFGGAEDYIWPDCDSTHPCVVDHIDTVAPGTAENEKPNPSKFDRAESADNLLTLSVTDVSMETVAASDNKAGNWESADASSSMRLDDMEHTIVLCCGVANGTNVVTIQPERATVRAHAL